MLPVLLLQYEIGRRRVPCKLFLRLGKHRSVLRLLGLQAWVVKSGHSVEILPARDLTRLRISLHCNLLETVLSGGSWVTKSHIIVTITTTLHINDTQVAHLTVSLAVIFRALSIAIIADLRAAVPIRAELELGEDVLSWRALAFLLGLLFRGP